MGKYVRFQLNSDFGEVNEDFESYKEAFRKYHRTDSPKTLYGFTEEGEISVIFSMW